MYTRYAEQRGWSVEILDATESDLGGYKSVTVAVKAKGTVEPGEAPYALLKFEGGVHRVQRVPVTESQGRVHTSAAGVLVMPEAEQVDVDDRRQRPAHRRLPLRRPRRPERQHHRLGRAHHARAHRHRGELPEREEPAAEQGVGDAHPARAAARRPPRTPPTPRPATRAARRSARSTAPSGSAPTTSRRTASPTTAPATRPTTSTRCSTATSGRCSTRASRPTWRPGSPLWSPECGASAARRAGGRAGSATAGVASPERDADLLLAHVLDVPLGRLPLVDDLGDERSASSTTPWWRDAPPGSRCST